MNSAISQNKSGLEKENEKLSLSEKGGKLIAMYENMAIEGYEGVSGSKVEVAYEDFELKLMKKTVRDVFHRFKVRTVLDYGSGGCNWNNPQFDDRGQSAFQYFQLEGIRHYEPARNIDQRGIVDCVISFDVLEHIYISDIPAVLRDMFSYAKKLVVLNVACYDADALLPNGENAHITVRHPLWWKGMVDSITVDFPDIEVFLLASVSHGKAHQFPIFSDNTRKNDNRFCINY